MTQKIEDHITVGVNAEQRLWIDSCAGVWGCSRAAAVRRIINEQIKHLTKAGFRPAKI